MRALADYAGLLGALFWDPGVLVWTPSDSLILPFPFASKQGTTRDESD